jgi:hypothetical protein
MDTGFLATHCAATASNSNLCRWCMRTVTDVLFTGFRDCSIPGSCFSMFYIREIFYSTIFLSIQDQTLQAFIPVSNTSNSSATPDNNDASPLVVFGQEFDPLNQTEW